MRTALIDNCRIAEFDHEIMSRLTAIPVNLVAVKNEKMLIALRNEDEEIYRIIGTCTFSKCQQILKICSRIGLVDELFRSIDNEQNWTAIFRKY